MASCGTHSSDGPTEHARFRSGKVAPRLRLSRRLALSVAEFLHPSTTRRLVNGPSARPSAGCTLVRALSRSRLPFYPREQMALESGSGRAHRGVKVSLCTFVGRRPLVLYVSIYGLSFDTACQYVLGLSLDLHRACAALRNAYSWMRCQLSVAPWRNISIFDLDLREPGPGRETRPSLHVAQRRSPQWVRTRCRS